jgi:hypothetical protein
MHFERLLTILLHFLVRVPDRLYFTFYVPMAQRKNLYPIIIFHFEESNKGFPFVFHIKFWMLGSGSSLYQKQTISSRSSKIT